MRLQLMKVAVMEIAVGIDWRRAADDRCSALGCGPFGFVGEERFGFPRR